MKSMTNTIRENLISYLDWTFLDNGAFVNVYIPSSGMYGSDNHKLYPIGDGSTWQSYRNNWVWESGTSVGSPISISGIFVNNSFVPVGSGYSIDYRSGTVNFDSAISESSQVYAERSHKWIDFQSSMGHPWFREIQKLSNRAESPQISNKSYGAWAQFGTTRVQLPCVLVNIYPPRQFKPFELGGGQYAYNDVVFTVLSESYYECSSIIDNISYNNDKLIYLYDVDNIAINNDFPTDINGELGDSPKTYPQLVNLYSRWFCYIHDMGNSSIDELSPGLCMGTLRCTTETKPI